MTVKADPYQHLNKQQREAVEIVDGRVLVLAGAGSGKTSVLTLRIQNLVNRHSVDPEKILGLTFTNKAAGEMRHRLAAKVGREVARRVELSTFHSFCLKILRSHIDRLGYTKDFTIYDEEDVKRVITQIARDLLGCEGELPSLATTIALIQKAKSKGIEPDEMEGSGFDWHDNFTKTLYSRLHSSMRAYNAVDFDGLLWLTVSLFKKCPDVLKLYQERFHYIMIDEYQDTNVVQYNLAHYLSEKHNNLFVVGDDDQSIYGWRGAEVKNILGFDRAKVIKLEQNYRSTNTILRAASSLITHNQDRHGKTLWSEKGDGEKIEVFNAPAEIEEAEAVCSRIAKIKKQRGLRWKDFAILYRSNALSRQLEMALMKHNYVEHDQWKKGIPYQIFGGTEFFKRREVKDLFAYMRTIGNPTDQEALLRIINQPRRGIGDETLDKLTSYNREQEIPLWNVLEGVADVDLRFGDLRGSLSSRAISAIRKFVELINEAKSRFSEGSLGEALNWLIETVHYKKAICDEVKSQKMQQMKWENVEELVSSLFEFEQEKEKEGKTSSLSDFLVETPLDNGQQQEGKKDVALDAVNLLTFHSSKGLEFPICFLVGLEDHIIPHEKSRMETGEDEERRLLYVGITRAQNQLILSMARKRKKQGKEIATTPSRFLHEIPKELMKVTNWGMV